MENWKEYNNVFEHPTEKKEKKCCILIWFLKIEKVMGNNNNKNKIIINRNLCFSLEILTFEWVTYKKTSFLYFILIILYSKLY